MATSRFAFGQIMDTVGATAGTIVTIVDTVNSSVSLLAATVEDARKKQAIRHTAGQVHYVDQITKEYALDAAKTSAAIKKAVADSEIDEADYTAAEAAIHAALAAKGLV